MEPNFWLQKSIFRVRKLFCEADAHLHSALATLGARDATGITSYIRFAREALYEAIYPAIESKEKS